jgi:heme iron utilization protein
MNNVEPARALIDGAHWFALATVAGDGSPSVSYVPFAPVEGGFGIAVSLLAVHTAHLAAHPSASVLVVGHSPPGDDPFVCPRLSIDVTARDVTGSPQGALIWEALARRNGATVEVLRTLPDFRTFLLEPRRGRLILGFAQASDLDAQALAALLIVPS